ncbi:MAG: hypothetical protein NBV57_04415 [Algoriphagus sp.]|nr:hypothetical protein [Algoriphagus sp.]
MRILFLTSLLLALSFRTTAQEIFIKTGINSTAYDFRTGDGIKLLDFTSGIGTSIEMGMGFPFVSKTKKEGALEKERSYSPNWFKNEVALNLDSYNSFSGDQNNNYSWVTTYGGITNSLSFLAHIGEVELGLRGLVGLSGMLSGTQVINNSQFTLKGEDDFQGLFVKTGLGVSASYPVLQRSFLNFTYTYSQSSRLGGPEEEHLRFLSHGLLFGLYVQLK